MEWKVSRRAAARALAVLTFGGLAGCGALDVSDPTAIEPGDVANATGAELLRRNAVATLAEVTTTAALHGGLLADEFFYDSRPDAALTSLLQALDQRHSQRYEVLSASFPSLYPDWQSVRRIAALAMPRIRTYTPEPRRGASLGELFAIRGYATLGLAAQICPGFPLVDFPDDVPVAGPPLSTVEIFERALADFDSAAAYAADSARVLDFARVGRGRALIGLGRFAEAAAAVADVPTDYGSIAQFDLATGPTNALGFYGALDRGVSDVEGGNGLAFVSAADARLPLTRVGTALDGITDIYIADKHADWSAPMMLASGIEARLIEAEAALASGGDWLGLLDALRTTCTDPATCPDLAPAGSGSVAGLPPLADPGTPEGRVDLLFRERAFWLFGTGHRLGDLRRLIAHYGRASEEVFPTGAYRLGGSYELATSIPFPGSAEAAANRAVTGCTSR